MLRFRYYMCVFVIFSIIKHSLTLSSQCYACHGEYCNDPFNKDRATIMSCSNSATLVNGRSVADSGSLANGDFKFEKWDSLEAKLNKIFRGLFGTTEYVCAKSLYFNTVHQTNMTIRSCMPKNLKGMDTCTYLSNIISGYGKVRTCSFCDTNICNSAINLRTSVLAVLAISILKIIF
ncbi:uncharacterized protein LOC108904244 [Anoplophora glabripennis]|uniref:uncharacterized protein LOC108904244 n=1 Tax=Anoplophora glabripennis TaxID=217634 RepID=UPI0008751D85|nr:uncharacterized protein LOC108904244 [Anoplophora glabripennis]